MTQSIAANSTLSTSLIDFRENHCQRIYLDEDCSRVESVILDVRLSFREKRLEPRDASAFLSYTYIERTVVQRIQGSCDQAFSELADLRKRYHNPLNQDLQEKITCLSSHTIPASEVSEEFVAKTLQFLENRGFSRLDSDVMRLLLKVASQAFNAQSETGDKIIKVSSKDRSLKKLNEMIDEQNQISAAKRAGVVFSKACIRVFPNRSTTITLPGSEKYFGSFKVVKRELMIAPDGELSLKRRYKFKDSQSVLKVIQPVFEKNLLQIAALTGKLIRPELIFETAKNKKQYLAKDCNADLFQFVYSFAYHVEDDLLLKFHLIPLEQQANAILDIMISLCQTLYEFHRQGFIHNDIKPENIVLDFNDERIAAYFCDLDMMCEEDPKKRTHKPKKGTPGYRHPAENTSTIYSDIYALGKTFFDTEVGSSERASIRAAIDILQQKAKKQCNHSLSSKLFHLSNAIASLSERMQSSPEDIETRKRFDLPKIILCLLMMKSLFIHNQLDKNTFNHLKMPIVMKQKNSTHRRSMSA